MPEHYHFLEYLSKEGFRGDEGMELMSRVLSGMYIICICICIYMYVHICTYICM